MKDMKRQDMGIFNILTQYIDSHSENENCEDNRGCIDCGNDCILNGTIYKRMELWDYEIKDVNTEISFNEITLDILVVATIYVSLTGDSQDDGNEITKYFHVEAILDFDQFRIKCVGVSVED